MGGIKELWPLFVIVAILASLVGMNVMQSRPTPEQINEIHQEMKTDRDAFQASFDAMEFDAEVVDNVTFVRKYPLPDVRYKLTLNSEAKFQKPDSLGAQTVLYDFSNSDTPFMWAATKGKKIKKGDKLTKKAGDNFYLVNKANGNVDTMGLEWRLFVLEELYEE